MSEQRLDASDIAREPATETNKLVGKWQSIPWGFTNMAGIYGQYSVDFISNHPEPDTILLPGYGEKHSNIEEAVRFLGGWGARVVGIRSEFPGYDQEIVTATIEHAPLEVTNHVRGNSARKISILGDCLGGLSGLILACNNPSVYGAVIAKNPLAFNTSGLIAEKPSSPGNALMRRLAVNGKREALRDEPAPMSLIRNMVQLVEYVVGQNGIELAGECLRQGVKVAIISGEDDQVVRAEELTKSLGDAGLRGLLHKVTGGHATLASRVGWFQMLQAHRLNQAMRPQLAA